MQTDLLKIFIRQMKPNNEYYKKFNKNIGTINYHMMMINYHNIRTLFRKKSEKKKIYQFYEEKKVFFFALIFRSVSVS